MSGYVIKHEVKDGQHWAILLIDGEEVDRVAMPDGKWTALHFDASGHTSRREPEGSHAYLFGTDVKRSWLEDESP